MEYDASVLFFLLWLITAPKREVLGEPTFANLQLIDLKPSGYVACRDKFVFETVVTRTEEELTAFPDILLGATKSFSSSWVPLFSDGTHCRFDLIHCLVNTDLRLKHLQRLKTPMSAIDAIINDEIGVPIKERACYCRENNGNQYVLVINATAHASLKDRWVRLEWQNYYSTDYKVVATEPVKMPEICVTEELIVTTPEGPINLKAGDNTTIFLGTTRAPAPLKLALHNLQGDVKILLKKPDGQKEIFNNTDDIKQTLEYVHVGKEWTITFYESELAPGCARKGNFTFNVASIQPPVTITPTRKIKTYAVAWSALMVVLTLAIGRRIKTLRHYLFGLALAWFVLGVYIAMQLMIKHTRHDDN